MSAECRGGLSDVWVNPSPAGLGRPVPTAGVLAFHSRLPGYEPSPLRSLPREAERLGLGELWVKQETWRLGLPSFKVLGASWAVCRAVAERLGLPTVPPIEELGRVASSAGPLRLVAATDGNHGRAVARLAALLGLGARILVPAGTAAARIKAIESEGASLGVVEGDYDEAVRRSVEEGADGGSMVISDTSWPGYERVPSMIGEGYATIFAEADRQLAEAGAGPPAAVVVPAGVGALAAAALLHYRVDGGGARVVTVEPRGAACVLRSLRAGHPVTVPGPHRSMMAGLNCGTPSSLTWPVLAAATSVALAIDDVAACAAMRTLAAAGVEAGETGAAALGGLTALCAAAEDGSAAADVAGGALAAAGVLPGSSALVVVTEGPTDPVSWEEIVGRPPTPRENVGPTPMEDELRRLVSG